MLVHFSRTIFCSGGPENSMRQDKHDARSGGQGRELALDGVGALNRAERLRAPTHPVCTPLRPSPTGSSLLCGIFSPDPWLADYSQWGNRNAPQSNIILCPTSPTHFFLRRVNLKPGVFTVWKKKRQKPNMQEKQANVDRGLVMHRLRPGGPHRPRGSRPVPVPKRTRKTRLSLTSGGELGSQPPESQSIPARIPQIGCTRGRRPSRTAVPCVPRWASPIHLCGLSCQMPLEALCTSAPGGTAWLPSPRLPRESCSPPQPRGDRCSPAHTPVRTSPLREARDSGPFVHCR